MIITTTVANTKCAFNAKDVKSLFQKDTGTEITFYTGNVTFIVNAPVDFLAKKVEMELAEIV